MCTRIAMQRASRSTVVGRRTSLVLYLMTSTTLVSLLNTAKPGRAARPASHVVRVKMLSVRYATTRRCTCSRTMLLMTGGKYFLLETWMPKTL